VSYHTPISRSDFNRPSLAVPECSQGATLGPTHRPGKKHGGLFRYPCLLLWPYCPYPVCWGGWAVSIWGMPGSPALVSGNKEEEEASEGQLSTVWASVGHRSWGHPFCSENPSILLPGPGQYRICSSLEVSMVIRTLQKQCRSLLGGGGGGR
jgi:hypothetical protein